MGTPLIGMAEVLDRLTDVMNAGQNIRPTYPEFGRLFAGRMADVFDSAGGGRWVNFAPSTIREHESPLVDEGIMRDGMTRAYPRHEEDLMVAFGPPKHSRRVQGVATLNTVGHRSRGSTMVPPRPVVPRLSSSERRQWLGVIEDHLREAIR